MNVIDALTISLGLDTVNFVKGQKEVAASLGKTKDAVTKTGQSVESSAEGMSEGLGKTTRAVAEMLAAFASAKTLESFVKSADKANISLSLLSASLGTSPQLLYAWGAAVERMGGSATTTQATVRALSDQLVDLLAQGKKLPESAYILEAAARKAGLKDSLDTSHGGEAYVESLGRLGSFLAKTDKATADRLLRETGVDPVTAQLLIRQGGNLPATLRENAREAPSDKDIKAARDLTDSWNNVNQAWDNAKTKLSTALTPFLLSLAKALTPIIDNISKWIEKNPKWVSEITIALAALSAGGFAVAIANVLSLTAALKGLSLANAAAAVGAETLWPAAVIAAAAAAGMTIGDYLKSKFDRGFNAVTPGANTPEMIENQNMSPWQRMKKIYNEVTGKGGGGGGSKVKSSANADAVADELRKAGMPEEGIAAALSSFQTESGMDPAVPQNAYNAGHNGMPQWDAKRWSRVSAWIKAQGGDPWDARWQARAFIAEGSAKPGDAIYDGDKTSSGFRNLMNSKGNLGLANKGMANIERFGPGEEGGRMTASAAWLAKLNADRLQAGARAAAPAGAAHSAALNNIGNSHKASTTSVANAQNVGNIQIVTGAASANGISAIDAKLAQKDFGARLANYGPY